MKKISKSERTREFIIEQTAGIFNTKGYAGTSMSDLTGATKLTKGSIYGNFENKEEVALAVFDYNYGKVVNIIKGEMARAQTWHARLRVYMNVYYDFQKYPFPSGGCPLLNTVTEADDTHPALHKKVADAVAYWKKNIMSIVNNGKGAGEFKQDTDVELFALTMMALIEGSVMIGNATGRPRDRKLIMRSVDKMINDIVA